MHIYTNNYKEESHIKQAFESIQFNIDSRRMVDEQGNKRQFTGEKRGEREPTRTGGEGGEIIAPHVETAERLKLR